MSALGAAAKEYTLCFLTYQDQILLLNRRKSPWMGSWNGVGGKRNGAEESVEECATREVLEETGYTSSMYDIRSSGRMQWMENGRLLGTLYLYWMELHDAPAFSKYPLMMEEGILAFQPIAWTVNRANTGVVSNLPVVIPALLAATAAVEFECDYDAQGNMTRMTQLC